MCQRKLHVFQRVGVEENEGRLKTSPSVSPEKNMRGREGGHSGNFQLLKQIFIALLSAVLTSSHERRRNVGPTKARQRNEGCDRDSLRKRSQWEDRLMRMCQWQKISQPWAFIAAIKLILWRLLDCHKPGKSIPKGRSYFWEEQGVSALTEKCVLWHSTLSDFYQSDMKMGSVNAQSGNPCKVIIPSNEISPILVSQKNFPLPFLSFSHIFLLPRSKRKKNPHFPPLNGCENNIKRKINSFFQPHSDLMERHPPTY